MSQVRILPGAPLAGGESLGQPVLSHAPRPAGTPPWSNPAGLSINTLARRSRVPLILAAAGSHGDYPLVSCEYS
ncbi:MAG: hypothetical protein ACRD2X_22225, partial [Vicinamibacteraceae bacterium]